ncbi:Pentatricopeptide repeat-containing protein [Quillaja saponaria]|uniref:Pentatricopeptide repeat-containing protein n=1 Tax=Quillaja saponaria TaxID=32244 RepID=A0AAD7KYU3_QUISA|nr:Pentatricopeptide repeat-containing protein [Quillaja saponaria]
MKLIPSNPWRAYGISRVLRALLYSTEAQTFSSRRDDSLYRRISRAGDPQVSIVPILDQWVEEGRGVKQSELKRFIKMLRNFRRFRHALQVSEWMTGEGNHNLLPGDVAVRLDLISKVHGLELAERYFNSIPETSRTFHVYGALLNCYAEHKSLDRAEATMQKLKDLGYFQRNLFYNVMLNLYSRMGAFEKLDSLVQEMEEKGITGDCFTCSIQLNAYAASSDIEAMEKLLMKMETNPLLTMDWNAYIAAANGYLKAELFEKAYAMMKKSELLINGKIKRVAYENLLTLYTVIGKKEDVYRIWELYKYKSFGKPYNSGYLCMLSSLEKLGDIDGAERILEEWESATTTFDIRLPNLLVTAYCKRGFLGKAEACIERLSESGKEPNASTWNRLALGYIVHNHMEKAVETLKKVILASQPGWKPNLSIVGSCIEYLKGKGDLESEMEILRLLRERGYSEIPDFGSSNLMKRDSDVEENEVSDEQKNEVEV